MADEYHSLVARHPYAVGCLAVYEPATVSLLPDGQSWMEFIGRLYQLYRDRGCSASARRDIRNAAEWFWSEAEAASSRLATNVAASEHFELMPLAADLDVVTGPA